MQSMTFMRAALAALATVLLSTGCEYTTAQNEGAVTLAELQGIQVEPVDIPVETTVVEDSTPEPTPTITGGSGIGPVGQGGGFLWKPISDNTKKLVVLLPPQYTGQVRGCYIASPSGAPIETGSFASVANGGREHYRYSKPGSGYPNGCHAVAMLKAGGSVHWTVPNTSARTSY